jgi:predicted ATPase
MNRFVTLSGCSGGGKSTLLAELARRGYATVEEPGRRIVQQELAENGSALPWIDAGAFLRRAIAMALADREAAAGHQGWVFFDRGLIDALSGLRTLGEVADFEALASANRYHRRVFLAPPWPEIYATDPERPHTLAEALPEYERLLTDYAALGYDVAILPHLPVARRADFILEHLSGAGT